MTLDTTNDIYFHDAGTQMFRFGYASNVSNIYGGAVSQDDLRLFSNFLDSYPQISLAGSGNLNIMNGPASYPYIQLNHSGNINMSVPVGHGLILNQKTQEFGRFVGNATTWTIDSATADQDMRLRQSSGGDIEFYSGAAHRMFNFDMSNGIFSGSSYHKGIENASDTTLTSPASGEVLVYKQNNARWENELPAMTFNVANVRLSGQQNLNITRFTTPGTTSCYLFQANACNSGGASVSGLKVELMSGSTSIYSTSSAILKQGFPLAKTQGDIEIRFAYSGGSSLSGYQYGTCLAQVGVW
jgi:hypothetical protein